MKDMYHGYKKSVPNKNYDVPPNYGLWASFAAIVFVHCPF